MPSTAIRPGLVFGLPSTSTLRRPKEEKSVLSDTVLTFSSDGKLAQPATESAHSRNIVLESNMSFCERAMGSLRENHRVMVLSLVDELSQRLPVSLLYRYYYPHGHDRVTY